MKTFNKLIEQANIHDFIDDITKYCDYKDKPLFRAIQNITDNYGIKQVRKDRKPRDSNSKYHEEFDKLFEEKFGIKARSQTLFCTFDYGEAEEYLNGSNSYICTIYPKSPAKCIYSKIVADLYNIANTKNITTTHYIFRDFKYEPKGKFLEEYNKNEFYNISYGEFLKECSDEFRLDWFKYIVSTYSIYDSIKSIPDNKKNEVMVYCDEYYYISSKNIENIEIMNNKEIFDYIEGL